MEEGEGGRRVGAIKRVKSVAFHRDGAPIDFHSVSEPHPYSISLMR